MNEDLKSVEIFKTHCVYCGTNVKLNTDEIKLKTFLCPDCRRENIVWALRDDYTSQIVQSNPTYFWVSLGIISSVIGLFLFPPAFGAFGMFCGYKTFNKLGNYIGGFVIILSIILMIIGLKYNPI